MSSVEQASALSDELIDLLDGKPTLEAAGALLAALSSVVFAVDRDAPGSGFALLDAYTATLATVRQELIEPGSIAATVAKRDTGTLQ